MVNSFGDIPEKQNGGTGTDDAHPTVEYDSWAYIIGKCVYNN